MGRTFACSDLHGMYNLYKQIKYFLQDDDIVYFLGDATDRGDTSWQTFKSIINDPQWIYLKGNHEDMLANAMEEYFYNDERMDVYYEHLAANGGVATFSHWLCDGAYKEWIKVIDNLSYQERYVNKNGQTILLSHAGFTPTGHETILSARDILWSRAHFLDEWPEDEDLRDVFIIHGHTPVPYLWKELGQPAVATYAELKCCWYADNHKCDIDLGAFATKRTCLLDLDTFEEHYFTI